MRAIAVIALACAGGAASAQEPLPVTRSVTLDAKGGGVYYVEGRRTIPARSHVSCQRGVRIVGRGDAAVLVVEGSFSTVGTSTERCRLEGLTIEPAATFKSIRLVETDLGSGLAIRTPPKQPCEGVLHLENARAGTGAALSVEMTAGELHLLSSSFQEPVRVVGLRRMVGERFIDNRTAVLMSSGSVHELEIRGVAEVTLRHGRLGGAATLSNCGELQVDGCRLASPVLVVEHAEPGGLSDTRFTKCDFHVEELVLRSPGSKKDTVRIDKAWFAGCEDEEAVRARVLRDGTDDDENGAVARITKLRRAANGLAGR